MSAEEKEYDSLIVGLAVLAQDILQFKNSEEEFLNPILEKKVLKTKRGKEDLLRSKRGSKLIRRRADHSWRS